VEKPVIVSFWNCRDMVHAIETKGKPWTQLQRHRAEHPRVEVEWNQASEAQKQTLPA